MTGDLYLVPIIQSGPADRAVIQAKSGDAYNMQVSSSRGAESRDVAGVLRDFRFYESDTQHGRERIHEEMKAVRGYSARGVVKGELATK
jgi:hypothetical protein